MTRHPMFAKRPTAYCDLCETTVYTDDIHSCHDAKALRAQQERERALTIAERAVVDTAIAYHYAVETFRVVKSTEGRTRANEISTVQTTRDALQAAIQALLQTRATSPRAQPAEGTHTE